MEDSDEVVVVSAEDAIAILSAGATETVESVFEDTNFNLVIVHSDEKQWAQLSVEVKPETSLWKFVLDTLNDEADQRNVKGLYFEITKENVEGIIDVLCDIAESLT